MDGVIYLAPVDARFERDLDVRFETVMLDDLLVSIMGVAEHYLTRTLAAGTSVTVGASAAADPAPAAPRADPPEPDIADLHIVALRDTATAPGAAPRRNHRTASVVTSSESIRQRAWPTIALCVVLTAGGCDDRGPGPTAPTPVATSGADVPVVGGTYAGTISAWLNEQPVGSFPITLTVTQSGNRITVEGTIESDGIVMDTASGTITADGTFTADLADDNSEACGRRTNRTMEIRFAAGSAEMMSSWQSEACGDARFEATLNRV